MYNEERIKKSLNATIKLSDEAADRMLEFLDNPPEPNEKLKQAKAHYDKSVIK